MSAAGRSPGRGQTPPGLPSPSSSLAVFIPSQKKNPPGWALGLPRAGLMNPGRLDCLDRLRSDSTYWANSSWFDGELLSRPLDTGCCQGGPRQLAARGGDELGEDGAV